MRIAEMEGDKEQQEQFKAEAQEAKDKFEVLNNARKAAEKAAEDEKKAKEEADKKKKIIFRQINLSSKVMLDHFQSSVAFF